MVELRTAVPYIVRIESGLRARMAVAAGAPTIGTSAASGLPIHMTTITEKDAMGATYTSNGSLASVQQGTTNGYRGQLTDERKLRGLIDAMRAAGDLDTGLTEGLDD